MVENIGRLSVLIISIQQHSLERLTNSTAGHEDGQDMIEYALLAGVLSVASVATAILVGPYLTHMYGAILQAWQST